MEESKKKAIMIAIIVGCLALAGAITYITNTGDSGGIGSKGEQMTWLKCRNPDCEHEYQMDLRDYFKYIREIREHQTPTPLALPPAIVCPECGDESVYMAEKCKKCGLVFETGFFSDKCPECGYSEIEGKR